mgnify:CR=1 FL=1
MVKKSILLFATLLFLQVMHILEEIFGNAWFIEDMYGGLRNFVLVMVMGFIISLFIFYFVVKNKKLAYPLSLVYASIVILDGLIHIIETLVLKKYFNGSAGLFTGIFFVIVGPMLIYYFKKEYETKKSAALIQKR